MNKLSSSRKFWMFSVLGVIAVILLYPFETTVVPEWKTRIVDESGNPMRETRIQEVWEHYSIETAEHQEDSITDDDGYVRFPRRSVRGSLLVRIGKPLLNVLNVHASFGPAAYLTVLHGSSLPDHFVLVNDTYTPGQPLPAQVIVRRLPQ